MEDNFFPCPNKKQNPQRCFDNTCREYGYDGLCSKLVYLFMNDSRSTKNDFNKSKQLALLGFNPKTEMQSYLDLEQSAMENMRKNQALIEAHELIQPKFPIRVTKISTNPLILSFKQTGKYPGKIAIKGILYKLYPDTEYEDWLLDKKDDFIINAHYTKLINTEEKNHG